MSPPLTPTQHVVQASRPPGAHLCTGIVRPQPLGVWGRRGLQSQLWERLSRLVPLGAPRGAQSLPPEGNSAHSVLPSKKSPPRGNPRVQTYTDGPGVLRKVPGQEFRPLETHQLRLSVHASSHAPGVFTGLVFTRVGPMPGLGSARQIPPLLQSGRANLLCAGRVTIDALSLQGGGVSPLTDEETRPQRSTCQNLGWPMAVPVWGQLCGLGGNSGASQCGSPVPQPFRVPLGAVFSNKGQRRGAPVLQVRVSWCGWLRGLVWGSSGALPRGEQHPAPSASCVQRVWGRQAQGLGLPP